MLKKILWVLFGFFSITIGLYPFAYLFPTGIQESGLLQTKSIEILSHSMWQLGFNLHIFCGGFALLIGWLQFVPSLRKKYLNVHRTIGQAYVILVFLSGVSAGYIVMNASGGDSAFWGFAALAIVWLATTLIAYLAILKGNINKHQNFMILSYAACWGAVTLRIWLPLLTVYFGDFNKAYDIVAWLSWVPNLLIGLWIIKIK